MTGNTPNGAVVVDLAPQNSRAVNPAFDVTPARLVSGFITEQGRAPATEAGLAKLVRQSIS